MGLFRNLLIAQALNQGIPNQYQEVEWIEGTGTQWLNLGTAINATDNIEFKFYNPSLQSTTLFGSNGGNTGNAFGARNSSNTIFSFYSKIGGVSKQDTKSLSSGSTNIVVWNGNPFNNCTLNGSTSGWNYNITSSDLATVKMVSYLFAENNNGTVSTSKRKMKLYYFKVEGKVDLVPCYRKSDGEIGMYDKVQRRFLTNQGSGRFNKGNNV